jgi:hypothetical protein
MITIWGGGGGDERENKTSMIKAQIPKNKMNNTRSMSHKPRQTR